MAFRHGRTQLLLDLDQGQEDQIVQHHASDEPMLDVLWQDAASIAYMEVYQVMPRGLASFRQSSWLSFNRFLARENGKKELTSWIL
jgi:hypothetical protein